MIDNNNLHDTIMDMEASLSTNFRGYSVWHYGAIIHGITRETLKNAIEALKAQEPRVMTPDEVKNAPEKSVVWLELKPDEIFKEEIYPFVGSGTGWYSCYCSANTTPMFTDDDAEQYGVKFRCWTFRPDEKRREETPWN